MGLWALFSKQIFFSARGRARFFVDLFHVSLTWLAFHDFRLVDFLLSRLKRRFSVLNYFEVYVHVVRVADATYLHRIKFSSVKQTNVNPWIWSEGLIKLFIIISLN